MNSYQPQQVSHYQQYQQKPFANHLELSPMMKSPLTKQRANVQFVNQSNPRQFVNTPVRPGFYQFQNKNDTRLEKKSLNQMITKTPATKETQLNKKFTPLSYKAQPKVVVEQEEKNKQYAKQTLKIVLVGFMILILIVGSFYSLILWDKMKTIKNQDNSQLSLTTNSTVVNGTVKIQSSTVSDKKQTNQPNQWKTLPADEQSPLGLLEHQKAPPSKSRHPHLRTISIQSVSHFKSQNPLLHRRKFLSQQTEI